MSQAEVDVACSHIGIWKTIAQSSAPYSLVLEDDVRFERGFGRILDQAWREMENADRANPGFDILYVSYGEVRSTWESFPALVSAWGFFVTRHSDILSFGTPGPAGLPTGLLSRRLVRCWNLDSAFLCIWPIRPGSQPAGGLRELRRAPSGMASDGRPPAIDLCSEMRRGRRFSKS
jgi:hypothetical protein